MTRTKTGKHKWRSVARSSLYVSGWFHLKPLFCTIFSTYRQHGTWGWRRAGSTPFQAICKPLSFCHTRLWDLKGSPALLFRPLASRVVFFLRARREDAYFGNIIFLFYDLRKRCSSLEHNMLLFLFLGRRSSPSLHFITRYQVWLCTGGCGVSAIWVVLRFEGECRSHTVLKPFATIQVGSRC